MLKRILLLITACVCINANAQLITEVSSWVDNPTVIAIPPMSFQGKTVLPEDISEIVRKDLESSGVFKAIDPKNMLSFPASEAEVVYRDWKQQKSEYLTVGTLEQTDKGYRLTFSLFDVITEKPVIVNKVVEGGDQNLRDIAHFVSDTIYEAITKIPGVFSTKIVYVEANRSGKQYRLMLSDVDGARARKLYSSSAPILSPSWSPDGRSIAYVSFKTGRAAIYTQDLATGKQLQITNFRGLNGAPVWSPDGSKLAMVLSKDGNPEIYVLNMGTRKLQRLTNHFSIDTEPAWSADGSSVLFTSNRGGKPQIYRAYLGSAGAERLTFEGDYNARPRVTPDGKQMIMVHQIDGVFHIASQNLENGRVTVLTRTRLDESPSIAPNGEMLIYATKKGGQGVLATVSLDGKVTTLLPSSSGDVREPAWSPFFK